MRELIIEYPDHIKGYGFLGDLLGETVMYGLSQEVVDKYEKVFCEFEEDPNIKPYRVDSLIIPKGKLKIYGVPKYKQLTFNWGDDEQE
jgi:hypothetical protein